MNKKLIRFFLSFLILTIATDTTHHSQLLAIVGQEATEAEQMPANREPKKKEESKALLTLKKYRWWVASGFGALAAAIIAYSQRQPNSRTHQPPLSSMNTKPTTATKSVAITTPVIGLDRALKTIDGHHAHHADFSYPAAGMLPFTYEHKPDMAYFLCAKRYSKKGNSWADFGGLVEPSDYSDATDADASKKFAALKETALREFDEEIMFVFDDAAMQDIESQMTADFVKRSVTKSKKYPKTPAYHEFFPYVFHIPEMKIVKHKAAIEAAINEARPKAGSLFTYGLCEKDTFMWIPENEFIDALLMGTKLKQDPMYKYMIDNLSDPDGLDILYGIVRTDAVRSKIDNEAPVTPQPISVNLCSCALRGKSLDEAQLNKEEDAGTLTIDVRHLPNPWHEYEKARGQKVTALDDPGMQTWLMERPEVKKFLPRLVTRIRNFMRKSFNKKLKNLTISIGCHGGKQRSVTLVEQLTPLIKKWKNVTVNEMKHKDLKANW